jgi:hypothetical protein
LVNSTNTALSPVPAGAPSPSPLRAMPAPTPGDRERLAPHHRVGGAIGLDLGRVSRLAHRRLALRPGPTAPLLHRVRHLVGEQVHAERIVGAVLAGAEVHVLADGERARAQPGGGVCGARPGVDPDVAEVGAKARFEPAARIVRQRCARRAFGPRQRGLGRHRRRRGHHAEDPAGQGQLAGHLPDSVAVALARLVASPFARVPQVPHDG